MYPEEVFENQFRLLGRQKGMELFQQAEKEVCPEEQTDFQEIVTSASAAYCHFRSTYLHVVFVRARNAGDKDRIRNAVQEEETPVMEFYDIVRHDSRIVFEAATITTAR